MTHDVTDIELTLAETPEDGRVDALRVLAAMEETLRRWGSGRVRIGLALVSDERMAQLNGTFLGHEGPTDVLTFDLRDELEPDHDLDLDGEVVVSVDTAEREAARRGHAPLVEAMLYAVHGTLHLLGHDDHDEAAAARMHDIEDEILMAMGAVLGREEAAT